MKSLIFIPFVLLAGILSSENVFARSLRSTADQLGKEVTQIGFGVALFGLVLGAIYLMVGRQDASTKITQCIMGIAILCLAPTIIKFIQGLT